MPMVDQLECSAVEIAVDAGRRLGLGPARADDLRELPHRVVVQTQMQSR